MSNIFKSTDSELIAATSTFQSVATANSAALGLTPGDLTTLTGLSTAYTTGYNAMITSREAAKAATQTKSTARKNLIADLRVLAQKIYANPAVSDALIAQLGLPVHDSSRSKVIPVSPASLVVAGFANGENKLTWKRNGNANSVVFWLEESIGDGNWALFATSTRTTFVQQNQTPGTMKYYRVRATANGLVSAPSNEAVVYQNGSGNPALHLAA